jgi:hypothetical protein
MSVVPGLLLSFGIGFNLGSSPLSNSENLTRTGDVSWGFVPGGDEVCTGW